MAVTSLGTIVRVRIARSLWLKAFVTGASAAIFIWLLQETMLDSKYATLPLKLIEASFDPTAVPAPGSRLAFAATAYCKGGVTSSGVTVQNGVTAADPALLPPGSLVQLDFSEDKYDGMYTVLDTGPDVQGREIDLYIWSCDEAQQFGRRSVRMTVLRLGWNPHATTRSLMDRLLRKPPAPREQEPLPSRPIPPGAVPAVVP
jgi:3D (Asp-Asp-Asp) domain-containing protein